MLISSQKWLSIYITKKKPDQTQDNFLLPSSLCVWRHVVQDLPRGLHQFSSSCILKRMACNEKLSTDPTACCLVTKSCPTDSFVTPRTAACQCPWDFLSKNTGVDCHALLQEIFPTQGCSHLKSPALASRFFTIGATWEA